MSAQVDLCCMFALLIQLFLFVFSAAFLVEAAQHIHQPLCTFLCLSGWPLTIREIQNINNRDDTKLAVDLLTYHLCTIVQTVQCMFVYLCNAQCACCTCKRCACSEDSVHHLGKRGAWCTKEGAEGQMTPGAGEEPRKECEQVCNLLQITSENSATHVRLN